MSGRWVNAGEGHANVGDYFAVKLDDFSVHFAPLRKSSAGHIGPARHAVCGKAITDWVKDQAARPPMMRGEEPVTCPVCLAKFRYAAAHGNLP